MSMVDMDTAPHINKHDKPVCQKYSVLGVTLSYGPVTMWTDQHLVGLTGPCGPVLNLTSLEHWNLDIELDYTAPTPNYNLIA